jgi:hypothetical protein
MSRTQESQDQFLKYRWEFLRRNEDYQNDYKEVERVFHKNDWSLDHYWIASISVDQRQLEFPPDDN